MGSSSNPPPLSEANATVAFTVPETCLISPPVMPLQRLSLDNGCECLYTCEESFLLQSGLREPS